MRDAGKSCESLQNDVKQLEEVGTTALFKQPLANSIGFRVFSTKVNSRMKCGNADQSSTTGTLSAKVEEGHDEGGSLHFNVDGRKADYPLQEAEHHGCEEGQDVEGNFGGDAGFDNSDDEEYSIESEDFEDDFDIGSSEDDDNDAAAAPQVMVPIKPKPQIGLYIPVISPAKPSRLSRGALPT